MKIADVSIRRPVFAFMMSIGLVVLGLFSYRDLGLDLMPKTEGKSTSRLKTEGEKPRARARAGRDGNTFVPSHQ